MRDCCCCLTMHTRFHCSIITPEASSPASNNCNGNNSNDYFYCLSIIYTSFKNLRFKISSPHCLTRAHLSLIVSSFNGYQCSYSGLSVCVCLSVSDRFSGDSSRYLEVATIRRRRPEKKVPYRTESTVSNNLCHSN